jgi:glycosyltransferase involved in cell wall biosynthesis
MRVRALCALLLLGLLAIDWWTVRLNPSIVYVALLALYVQLGGRKGSWGLGLAMVGLIYAGYFLGARSTTVASRLDLFRKSGMLNRTFVACTVLAIGMIARKRWGAANESLLPESQQKSSGYPRFIGDDTLVAAVCFLLTLTIFVLDLAMPLPFNPAILYGIIVVLAGRTQSRSFLWGLTMSVLVLTLFGYAESDHSSASSRQATFLTNRVIVMFVLVALATVVHVSLKEVAPAVWSATNKVQRILHVISGIHPRQGGPPAALFGFSKAQIRAGKEVTVISIWGTEEEVLAAERFRAVGVKVILVGPTSGPLMRHPDLRRAMLRAVAQADVVHIHGVWEEIQHQAARASQQMGVPHIFRPCGMLDPWSLAHHRMRKLVYMSWRLRRDLNHASAIHLTTPAECEAVGLLNLVTPVIVEPLGVDLDEFNPLPPAGTFRQLFPTLLDRRCIVFFGRVCPKKGVHLLLEAMALLVDKSAMLVLVGPVDADYQATLDAIISRHQLAERVLFVGMITGRARVAALSDCDLFVLPSFQENFGVAVVEAMASRCPVIVSSEVAIARDIVEWGAGAIAPLESHGLAAVIDEWLAHPARRREAGDHGREAVFSHYDWDQVAQGWEDHYQYLSNVASHRIVAIEESGPATELVQMDA